MKELPIIEQKHNDHIEQDNNLFETKYTEKE